jgi:hypothetical protein
MKLLVIPFDTTGGNKQDFLTHMLNFVDPKTGKGLDFLLIRDQVTLNSNNIN